MKKENPQKLAMKKGSKGKKTVMSPSVHLFCYQPLYFAPGNKSHMSFCNFGDLGALSNKKNSLFRFDQSSLKEAKKQWKGSCSGLKVQCRSESQITYWAYALTT